MAFTQGASLLRHGERPYKCIARGMAFVKRASLLCHERTHTGERPIRRRLQSASAVGDRRLAELQTSAATRTTGCCCCGYTYDRMLLLRLHVQLGFQSAIQFGSLQVQNNPTDYNK